jgi:SSS family solute:Na+ symporter
LVLVYLVSYVGVNLFTMGTVLNILLGWNVLTAAILVATISAIYVTAGGQTSVVMTDLFQGIMLLATGFVILALGAWHLGGIDEFWNLLPRGHRTAFDNFNQNPSFPSVGITWQDGMANTAMFYFLNQGMVMRFMSARSVQDGRKAMIAVVLVLMPLAACVVASGGWVAQALVQAGMLPPDLAPGEAFFIASEFLSTPGIFGLILAALTAALMSTVDTLITAVSAVVVNDVYKPCRPKAKDPELLRVARISAVSVTLLGIALVPIFQQFKTIYEAHGAMTAAVTPPLVVVLLLSVFWRRFTAPAALATVVGGTLAIALSIFVPQVIEPFAHGVPAGDRGEGLLGGMTQYKFMRACYGICISLAIGVGVTLFTRPEPSHRQRGLVWGTVAAAIEHYKGSPGSESAGRQALALPLAGDVEPDPRGQARLPVVSISRSLARELEAEPADLVYITDRRWWTGGLNSVHAIVGEVVDGDGPAVRMGPETFTSVVAKKRGVEPVKVQKLY